jgi:hypothetical protein
VREVIHSQLVFAASQSGALFRRRTPCPSLALFAEVQVALGKRRRLKSRVPV